MGSPYDYEQMMREAYEGWKEANEDYLRDLRAESMEFPDEDDDDDEEFDGCPVCERYNCNRYSCWM